MYSCINKSSFILPTYLMFNKSCATCESTFCSMHKKITESCSASDIMNSGISFTKLIMRVVRWQINHFL